MVSIRCEIVVKSELESLGLHYSKVELGEADIEEDISDEQYKQLDAALKKSGLELIDDKKSKLIEKIKNLIIQLIHYSDTEENLKINFPDYLSKKLQHNYTYLANLFSEVHGTTIEQYIIYHKIEKVKELLVHEKLTLTEIAYQLNYSSVAHLSTQFKKVTGLTASHFKKLRDKKSITCEDI